MITLQNPENHIKYFLNSNHSILYIFNTQINEIKTIYSNAFRASTIEVISEGENTELNIQKIINEENDFIETVNVIASTIKRAGNFLEIDNTTNISTNYLNIYLNAENFLTAQRENNFIISEQSELIYLLEEHTPTILKLIKNLFYNEADEVIINFLNYLHQVAFTDNKQDIMFLFKGTSEEMQGQGAGKGVCRDLLFKLFSNLICSVSNETYNDKFNAELLNKKIVIFDEIDFKSLKYAKLKDITGSSTLRVENKGKDALIVPNVSSWLLFTNDHDLHNKIKFDDRRTFIIHPNPKNGSLKSEIINNYYNSDFNTFEACLLEELEDFIHIISLATEKVKSPLELRTNAHSNYFSENNFNLKNINRFEDIFTKKTNQKKFIDFLEELKNLEEISDKKFKELKYFLEKEFYYNSILEDLFNLCLTHQIADIKAKSRKRLMIKSLKEILINNEHEPYTVDTTFMFEERRYKIKKKGCVRLRGTTKKEQKELNRVLKRFHKF